MKCMFNRVQIRWLTSLASRGYSFFWAREILSSLCSVFVGGVLLHYEVFKILQKSSKLMNSFWVVFCCYITSSCNEHYGETVPLALTQAQAMTPHAVYFTDEVRIVVWIDWVLWFLPNFSLPTTWIYILFFVSSVQRTLFQNSHVFWRCFLFKCKYRLHASNTGSVSYIIIFALSSFDCRSGSRYLFVRQRWMDVSSLVALFSCRQYLTSRNGILSEM